MPAAPEVASAEPYDHPAAPPLAGFWRRSAAFLIDVYCAAGFVTSALWLTPVLTIPLAEAVGIEPPDVLSLFAASMIAGGLAAVVFYFTIPELLSARATPGKLAVGIRIDAWDGTLTARTILARRLSWWISCATFGLGFVWMLRDPQHRTLHDRMSKSCVRRQKRSLPRAVVEVALVLVLAQSSAAFGIRMDASMGSALEDFTAQLNAFAAMSDALDEVDDIAYKLQDVSQEPLSDQELRVMLYTVDLTRADLEGAYVIDREHVYSMQSVEDALDQAERAVNIALESSGADRVESAQDSYFDIAMASDQAHWSLGRATEVYRVTPSLMNGVRELLGLPAPESTLPPEMERLG